MGERVFSYCLFEPKSLPQHRFWDKWKEKKDRYWYNVLSLPLTNKILFPEYSTILHVSPNVWDNPLSAVIDLITTELSNFKVQTVNIDYKLTEPAIWRMMPLWRRDVDVFHTRDLDSLPSKSEKFFINEFENSDCSMGTIRSHENHHGVACRMLAGLSSFKPALIPINVKGPDFNYYYSQRHQNYGSDQDLMIKTFTNDSSYTGTGFLDYKINKQENSQSFACRELDRTKQKPNLTEEQEEVFTAMEKYVPIAWLGEPCDTRGPYTKFILSKHASIASKIEKHALLKRFYFHEDL